MTVLTVEDLGMQFDAAGVTALQGVTLDVRDGEFVSIVGPSGCGKSTLFSIVAGLRSPTSGRVLLDGCEPDAMLGQVALMPQRDLLMPWRTVLDNVCVPLELQGLRRSAARERVRGELGRFGLEGFEGRRPSELSGGMRQRAALLRTFLCGRDVLLLDEPFGALDALTRRAMQAWLLDVWSQDRKTILFITHDVEEALFLSDRVYVMSGRPGRVTDCVSVPFARPRGLGVMREAGFGALKERLLAPLEEAVTA
jgi:ABC-type nitrate/sulfonate/bicarbonate transport system ATPase subunit